MHTGQSSPHGEIFLYISDAGGLFGVEKVKPDPWNLAVNTGVGKQMDPFRTIISLRGDFLYTSDAGGLFGVEKVEPDPWNLAVNTGVGKQYINPNH